MKRIPIPPALAAIPLLALLTGFAYRAPLVTQPSASNGSNAKASGAFIAQVVGVQWLNPLQRRDYSTEWQLLWTLGISKPNKNDDLVRSDPNKFSSLQPISSIALGENGRANLQVYHEQYIDTLIVPMHDVYFSSSRYFYNAHSLEDRSTWRELAEIHIKYALPHNGLEPSQAAEFVQNHVNDCFQIGNENFPKAWSDATPPDVRITLGGPNAGFTSLTAALDYLQAHPNKTVWAMNWDAPSRPKDKQINENMVLLVLAGPDYKTERDPVAWIGYPATRNAADFEKKFDLPPRVVQAWKATLDKAAQNAGKDAIDIGYVIHDANNTHADSAERIGNLAHVATKEIVEFDFVKQSFNTSALLGDMGAGSALTNVALGIAYANHIGKNVLVAGTTELDKPTAVVVVPPGKVRPIDHEKPWFRARGENNAHLMWWGLRHDAKPDMQGYSK